MSTDVTGLKSAVDDSWTRLDLKTEDSRLKYSQITHPTQPYERTFCVVCCKPKGWVTVESYNTIKASNIIVICDDCASFMGPTGLQEAPIQEVKGVK